MKKTVATALAALALTGCVSEAQRAVQQAEYERAETNLANRRGVANIQCQDQASCEGVATDEKLRPAVRRHEGAPE
jgi:uncharacterized protein YcfL